MAPYKAQEDIQIYSD